MIAESGTELVAYHGFHSRADALRGEEAAKWDAIVEFDATIGARDVRFFQPYTTTLVELRMNREPLPLEGANRVFWFMQTGQ